MLISHGRDCESAPGSCIRLTLPGSTHCVHCGGVSVPAPGLTVSRLHIFKLNAKGTPRRPGGLMLSHRTSHHSVSVH